MGRSQGRSAPRAKQAAARRRRRRASRIPYRAYSGQGDTYSRAKVGSSRRTIDDGQHGSRRAAPHPRLRGRCGRLPDLRAARAKSAPRARLASALAGDGLAGNYAAPSWLPTSATPRRRRLRPLSCQHRCRWRVPRVRPRARTFGSSATTVLDASSPGNKIRKLEFLLAEALEGGSALSSQSGVSRATTAVRRQRQHGESASSRTLYCVRNRPTTIPAFVAT